MTSLASAAERPIVAVFDMEDRGSGLDKQVLVNLTDYLASLLAEGGYQVVPRDQIRERLKEQKTESYKECYDQSCQIELGRELAAQKSLDISILKIGNQCQMTANLYDLKKSTTELAANADADCNEESLLKALRDIANKLCQPLQGADDAVRMSDEARKLIEEQAREKAEEARRKAEKTRQSMGLVHPIALENMRMVTAAAFDFTFIIGEVTWPMDSSMRSIIAGAGLGSFEYSFGNFSIGAALSIAFSEPDVTYDGKKANYMVGNPTLNFKARWCSEGAWTFCYGTSTSLSASFWDWTSVEGDSAEQERIMILEQMANEAGMYAAQDPTYHDFQKLVFRPLGVVSMIHGNFFAQCQVGFAFDAPLINTDTWRHTIGAKLIYGLAAGYRAGGWFVPLLELNGWTILEGKYYFEAFMPGNLIDTFLFLNLGARFEGETLQPVLRASIPLTKERDGFRAHIQVGLAAEF
jgi:hypothetical protein